MAIRGSERLKAPNALRPRGNPVSESQFGADISQRLRHLFALGGSPRRYGPTTAQNPILQRAIAPVHFRGGGSANRCHHREYRRFHPSNAIAEHGGATWTSPSQGESHEAVTGSSGFAAFHKGKSHADPSSSLPGRGINLRFVRLCACSLALVSQRAIVLLRGHREVDVSCAVAVCGHDPPNAESNLF